MLILTFGKGVQSYIFLQKIDNYIDLMCSVFELWPESVSHLSKTCRITFIFYNIMQNFSLSFKHNTFVSSYDKDDSSSFSLVVIMKEFNIYWPKNASAAAFLKKITHHVATQAPWKLYKTFIFLLSKSHLHLSV